MGWKRAKGVIVSINPRKAGITAAVFILSIGGPAWAQSQPAAATVPTATPIGSPAAWFPADAYPPEAKAAGIQGRTAFKLDLDPQGRITECDVTQSSGSALLDSTTCQLLVTNARFKPAHNAQGQAVAGTWSSAMVWQLAAPEAPPPETINDFTGISPADAYNQSLTDAMHAQQQAEHPDQGGGGGGGDDGQ
jgi:TonB family protein